MLVIRSQEADGQLKRLISILEMQHSDFDPMVREYSLGSGGIQIGEPFVKRGSLGVGLEEE